MEAVSRRETCLICGVMLVVVSMSSMAASLAQMKQQCDKVLDAQQNLNCSVSVLARMFETKAANQLPKYYLTIKRRHAQAIANDPELKLMFSMFGSESIATLRAVADFSARLVFQTRDL